MWFSECGLLRAVFFGASARERAASAFTPSLAWATQYFRLL